MKSFKEDTLLIAETPMRDEEYFLEQGDKS